MSMHKETMKYLMKLIHGECGGDKDCMDALWDEIHSETIKEEDTFSTDKMEAYNKMKEILESNDKYELVGKDWVKGEERVRDNSFEVTNKKDNKKTITLENNEGNRAYIITALPKRKPEYSEKGMEEINNKWTKYGRSPTRKKYDYSGKNIKETMSMIDNILA